MRAAELETLAARLLSDAVTESITWEVLDRDSVPPLPEGARRVETAVRPGVTDPVGAEIVRAAHMLGITSVRNATTGLSFDLYGENLNDEVLALLMDRLLANPVVQRAALGRITPIFPAPARASGQVETIRILGLSRQELMDLSRERRTALDEAEMLAIQAYCQSEGRDLTDVELETIAQTWSEHCVHKTFKARIEIENYMGLNPSRRKAYPEPVVDNLMRTFLRAVTEKIAAPWVRSAFVDNAGIVEYDGVNEISFKVETHNHPSAIEPFGGANTGTGGVIRDVLGVSARPVAATDVLCFGQQDLRFDELPEGVLHPQRIAAGVVSGIEDYGNKIGIPTVSGAVLYDAGYTSNPLVYCGCVGIAPLNSHPRDVQPGDRVIVIGGRTGRDGLRGATFSSMTMDAQTGEVAGASVQIGAPITEKGCIEVVLRARDEKLYNAITDCGAGGLSSAVGEMSSEIGADVELQDVLLKYPGLAPWEIWLSEAQERMVLAVPPANVERLGEICAIYDVEWTDIGEYIPTGRLMVRYASHPVLNLANDFLHGGIPQRRLRAILPLLPEKVEKPLDLSALPQGVNAAEALLKLLSHPNIASKEAIIRVYDHEVMGGTLVKPLCGVEMDGPADAAVLQPQGTVGKKAIALGAGINSEYGKADPYAMACAVIDEAVRNVVAAGADPDRIGLLDNFCWGDPLQPLTLGSLLEACRGCYDTALAYEAPFISGKDSLNNEYLGIDGKRHAIPPTLLISALGHLQDSSRAVTMDLKESGNLVYLAGNMAARLGTSHYRLAVDGGFPRGEVPPLLPKTREVYQAIHTAMSSRMVRACHDLSEGGLAVAAAEMCIAGRLGMAIDIPEGGELTRLFGETNGCLLIEVNPAFKDAFEEIFEELPLQLIGRVRNEPELVIRAGQAEILRLPVSSLSSAWKKEGGR